MLMMFRLANTGPVTTAENERSFSKLKLIQNSLRNSMSDNRLNNLMLIAHEKDIVDSLDLKDLAVRWSKLKKRRISLGTE